MRDYIVKQLKEVVIPDAREGHRASSSTSTGCASTCASRRAPRTTWSGCWRAPSTKPSPIDAYFGGVYYIGPIFTAFRGTPDATEYYRAAARRRSRSGSGQGSGRSRPRATWREQKYRLVVEGPPNWTSFREFWKMFYDEGAVVVASSYTKVGGIYDFGLPPRSRRTRWSRSPTTASAATRTSTCRSASSMLETYIREYEADGLLINSIKSCNSFSAGQLMMMRELEKRTGKPAALHRDRPRRSRATSPPRTSRTGWRATSR